MSRLPVIMFSVLAVALLGLVGNIATSNVEVPPEWEWSLWVATGVLLTLAVLAEVLRGRSGRRAASRIGGAARLAPWRAKIRDASGRVLGTGFLVVGRKVLTSAAVLRGTKRDVQVEFPIASESESLNAEVASGPDRDSSDVLDDVAVLALPDPADLPEAAALAEHGPGAGSTVRAFCFPPQHRRYGLWCEARVLGSGGPEGQWHQLSWSERGRTSHDFSGAPVVDSEDRVVGMVVAEEASEDGHTSWMVSPDVLRSHLAAPRVDQSLDVAALLDSLRTTLPPRSSGRLVHPRGAVDRRVPVLLSTSSVYPEPATAAFEIAADLGYDGVEVMVWTDEATQDPRTVSQLADHYEVPVLAVHAPCLLITQRVWSADPWERLRRAVRMAEELGAPTVVVHPPFVWQRHYVRTFATGLSILAERHESVRVAVENLYPVRMAGRYLSPYAPHWDPTTVGYRHYGLNTAHCAASGVNALDMAERMGDAIAHLHLSDGIELGVDQHLVPGRGAQPCGEVLQRLAASGFDGAVTVEVNTRKAGGRRLREADLAEALAFARLHLARLSAAL